MRVTQFTFRSGETCELTVDAQRLVPCERPATWRTLVPGFSDETVDSCHAHRGVARDAAREMHDEFAENADETRRTLDSIGRCGA